MFFKDFLWGEIPPQKPTRRPPASLANEIVKIDKWSILEAADGGAPGLHHQGMTAIGIDARAAESVVLGPGDPLVPAVAIDGAVPHLHHEHLLLRLRPC